VPSSASHAFLCPFPAPCSPLVPTTFFPSSQASSAAALCNIVVDFLPPRHRLLEAGIAASAARMLLSTSPRKTPRTTPAPSLAQTVTVNSTVNSTCLHFHNQYCSQRCAESLQQQDC